MAVILTQQQYHSGSKRNAKFGEMITVNVYNRVSSLSVALLIGTIAQEQLGGPV